MAAIKECEDFWGGGELRHPSPPKRAEQEIKKLGKALKVVRDGILKNVPGPVKSSVREAIEVLGSLLNTHKCSVESEMKIQKRLEKKLKGGEKMHRRLRRKRRDNKSRRGDLRPSGPAMLSGCWRRMASPTPRF